MSDDMKFQLSEHELLEIMNAQPFAETRNDPMRVWQLFGERVHVGDAIKAILSLAEKYRESPWRPIAEAPKDEYGPAVLIYSPELASDEDFHGHAVTVSNARICSVRKCGEGRVHAFHALQLPKGNQMTNAPDTNQAQGVERYDCKDWTVCADGDSVSYEDYAALELQLLASLAARTKDNQGE